MKAQWVLPLMLLNLTASSQTPSDDQQFMLSMDKSMSEMDREMVSGRINGGVDHDFAVMMIPHHQGAIEMAKAELAYGKDPVMRRLAQEIIADQHSEIDAMQLWLNKRTARPAH